MSVISVIQRATKVLDSVRSDTYDAPQIIDMLLDAGVYLSDGKNSNEYSLNESYPDMLRQWIVEKMIEHHAIQHLPHEDDFVSYAAAIEKFIKEGNKDDG